MFRGYQYDNIVIMDQGFEGLTKKERKELKKLQTMQEFEREQTKKKMFKWGILLPLIALVLWGSWWVIKESSKPLPGVAVEDLGRKHVADISDVKYNSNPPTSGTHFPIWAKRGVYDRVISDGHLIHSLEHGYIVLSYHCDDRTTSFIPQAFAHEDEEAVPAATGSAAPLMQMKVGKEGDMSAFTPENPPDVEVALPESFSSEKCQELVENLSSLLDDYDRVIIVPRVNQEDLLVATAWTRILKLNSFDKEKIKSFIEAYHNKGPERTVE